MSMSDDELQKAAEKASQEFPEGLSDLAMGAAQIHELYQTYIAVGFSDSQALYVIGCCLTGNPGMLPIKPNP